MENQTNQTNYGGDVGYKIDPSMRSFGPPNYPNSEGEPTRWAPPAKDNANALTKRQKKQAKKAFKDTKKPWTQANGYGYNSEPYYEYNRPNKQKKRQTPVRSSAPTSFENLSVNQLDETRSRSDIDRPVAGGQPGGTPSPKKRKRVQEVEKEVEKEPEEPPVVAIFHVSYPMVHLTLEQLDHIQANVVAALAELPGDAFFPRFVKAELERGSVVVECADRKSAEWLKTKIPGMRPWQDVALEAVDMKDFPMYKKVAVCIPGPCIEAAKVLQLLRSQNEDVDTSKWIVLESAIQQNSGFQMLFAMDQKALAVIQQRDHKLFFGMGQVAFKVRGPYPQDIKEEPTD
ncbi:uncharacterized protein LOC105698243 [Orussus abietinus]|uniref:uncharacterized protein LOC105698243 n=1 Tax=Orussus abietinus TaxID=222816 RepID=UPI000625D6FA|nr:uncharacterized protein LOC105698243 [Orussus abietinus]